MGPIWGFRKDIDRALKIPWILGTLVVGWSWCACLTNKIPVEADQKLPGFMVSLPSGKR